VSGPVRLRGHHFVCLQFYRGEGYDDAFVANLSAVLERLAAASGRVVSGADDVCVACPNLAPDGACADPHAGEAEIARLDALATELLGIHPGDDLSLAQAAELLAEDAVAAGRWRYEACDGCAWEHVCEAGWSRLLRG